MKIATEMPPSNFNPRPPRGGRPLIVVLLSFGDVISIHALREEGDRPTTSTTPSGSYFNPRPPRGGRRIFGIKAELAVVISIHALREEGDRGKRAPAAQ